METANHFADRSSPERRPTGPIMLGDGLRHVASAVRSLPHRNAADLFGRRDLYRYSVCALAGHGATLLFLVDTSALSALSTSVEPYCWPYFESCWKFRFDSPAGPTLVIVTYATLIAVALTAAIERMQRTYWWTLLAMNGLLFVVMSMDYRLRSNELYMLFWLNAVLLFLPSKQWCVPSIVVSFYFWAGISKLNYEWVSGSVLYKPLFLIPKQFTWVACAYVVALETTLIWGLVSKRRLVVWATVAQLAAFHIQSLSQIHWYYPLLMTTILAWFVLRHDEHILARPTPAKSFCAPCVLACVFGFLQLSPWLHGADRDLTGEGRLLALHMFEARQQCEVEARLLRFDGSTETVDLQLRNLPPRSVCDPVIYFNRVANLCRTRNAERDLVDVDFRMRVKRTTDPQFTTVVDERSFCAKGYNYSLVGGNAWIHRVRKKQGA
jgi:hypothetical protein